MPIQQLLTEQEIQDMLEEVPLWIHTENYIIKEMVFENYVSVIGYVNSISFIAERLDHHPELYIYGWNKLRISLSTFDSGGLTDKDFKLAKLIDNIK